MDQESVTRSIAHRSKQQGVTTVEYAIMLVLIAVAVAIAAPSLSSSIVSVFSKTSSVLGQ